ncbi:MAG: BREX-2 system adenine-specific DNA-methyltransferase PglX, partial [Gammaproteobacteria bacterium]
LWGARPGQFAGMESAATSPERQFLYRTEHADALRRIFDRHYTAVAGNPPYIIARDKALNAQYRARYPLACSGKYSLAAPFMQCFFDLAVTDDGYGRPAGYVGMITTNQFMKRQSGKKLIEKLIPTWDVTHVIDTAGVHISGHGTPTVILFGRHRPPFKPVIRAVMGIRGKPAIPTEPGKDLVWNAIVEQIDEAGSESEFISVNDVDRARYSKHPWSIGGGGASELKELLDEFSDKLCTAADAIGITAVTGEDDLYLLGQDRTRRRLRVPAGPMIVEGAIVRDWRIRSPAAAIWPYDDSFRVLPPGNLEGGGHLLWLGRAAISGRKRFGTPLVERGLTWWEWQELYVSKLRSALSITFAEMETHNHFVLDRGGKVFNRTAPVIKLPEAASVDEHLGLVGVLNSAIACFWMQQVFHNKGAGGGARVDAGYAALGDEGFLNVYVHNATTLKQFPIPPGPPPVELARTLEGFATEFAALQPGVIAGSATPTRARLDAARAEAERIFTEMVAAQEELDWTCLHLYRL